MGRGRASGAPPDGQIYLYKNCGAGQSDQASALRKFEEGAQNSQGAEAANAQQCRSRHCAKPASGKQTKQQTCLDLLGRREGATIEDFEQATGWQKHSVRGFLAGEKKLGLALISEKPDAGPRRYRIPTKA